MYLKADLKKFDLTQLGLFDVILMDPPWKEYYKRAENMKNIIDKDKFKPWALKDIGKLQLNKISSTPTFLFMWCGCDHLLDGRTLFNQWGFKRCEDIVWIKTNKKRKLTTQNTDENSIFQKVTEHCLVGLSGDVRRASDQYFIHANIDTDVIVAEEEVFGSKKKPDEIYRIIERFCLGRKRLELFGDNESIRPGWVTIGENIGDTNFNRTNYERFFTGPKMPLPH
jgi:mRNA m6A methyltransferase non-catalytic subunit